MSVVVKKPRAPRTLATRGRSLPSAPKVVTTRPKAASTPRAPKQRDGISLVIEDVTTAFTGLVETPLVLATGAIAVALIMSHLAFPSGSILDQWIAALAVYQPRLAAWLALRETVLYGVAAYIPAWLSIPKGSDYRGGMLVAMAVWLFVMPEAGPWEYVIQAAAIRVFFSTKRSTTRVALVVGVAVFYMLGFAESTPALTTLGASESTTPSTPRPATSAGPVTTSKAVVG